MIKILTIFTFLTSTSLALNVNNKNIKPIFRGVTKPFENNPIFKFETLPIIKNIQPSFLREAELKHCRIAMLASIIIPTIEIFTDEPGIFQFNNLPGDIQLYFISLMFLGEFASMIKGWKNPTEKLFELKDDYQPGDLGLVDKTIPNEKLNVLMDKELNNGRLAMIGILGIIIQELITNIPIFKVV